MLVETKHASNLAVSWCSAWAKKGREIPPTCVEITGNKLSLARSRGASACSAFGIEFLEQPFRSNNLAI